MEDPFASREKGFGYQDMPTEQMDGFSTSFGSGVRSLISDDLLNSSSELMNFDSFAAWCNTPSAADILFSQYGLLNSQPMPFGAFHAADSPKATSLTRSFHDLETSYFGEETSLVPEIDNDVLSGKRRRVNNNHKIGFPDVLNCTIPRSLSHSLDEKMLKALSLFMESSGSGEGILAQVWTPIKIGDQYVLSTCDQAYLLDPRLSQYREVSRKFTFAAEANQRSFPGLPGRVFISGVPEWTSNVMYYKTDEYLRMKHAIDNEVRGSIAIPVLEASGTSCCAVMEFVTSKEKPNFDMEMDSVCRALQAVNLRTTAIPRPQYLSRNQRDALAEIQDVLRAVSHAHKLPLALAWIPCRKDQSVRVPRPNSGENYVLCIEETACYVNDMEMEGFVHACLEHCLREKEGIVGKAFISNQPFFSSDVKAYDISEYPLVQHARKYGLNAAVAIKLRSTYTGEDDYILELFLPVSMKGSLEQQLLLDSLSGTMQRICRTLRTVSEVVSTKKEVIKPGFQSGEMSNFPQTTCLANFQTTSLDSEYNSTRSIFSGMSSDKDNGITVSQGILEQDMSKARTLEKKKSTTEKNVSLSILQQHFSGSLKDAAKSLGVCPTTLKRICRQHGIMRWPSRKINKVNRSLRKIQTVLDSVQGVEGGLKYDSATGEFIAVGPFIQKFDTQNGLLSHINDTHARKSLEEMTDDTSFELQEAKFVDNAVKLEEDITMNHASTGSFMEVNASGQPWDWMVEQSGLNGSEGIKSVCNLSSLEISDRMDPTIRCSGSIVEPNQSMSCSISDSSNGSGAIMRGSSSTSVEDWNQMRSHNNNSGGESGSTMLIVKATYREDTVRFKFEPSAGCSQLYKEVGKRFKLQDGSFQLKYLDDEEEWVMMVTESDLQECLEILYGMGKQSVKFMVRDLPPPIGSSAGSNGYLGTCL
ncbi:PREDICTED: protein NLP8-like isoform X1 [Camelina sativa]|uniref:Protein NLP8-like isoform X1 n=1 Tax=Camelina sativa TaxID=90675 RepID=A0ABM0YZS4_CAMSA|nr:PREDICTED: protein NLP8-like isoform X1 [Camelina sativa]XP_010508419.1 PREDICTED: protein NLP8-like isoform X1 [Camelina sativa]XP_010508420.1 PREDICTED: protein NLP8-like isoform X1 [Camelina sativa]